MKQLTDRDNSGVYASAYTVSRTNSISQTQASQTAFQTPAQSVRLKQCLPVENSGQATIKVMSQFGTSPVNRNIVNLEDQSKTSHNNVILRKWANQGLQGEDIDPYTDSKVLRRESKRLINQMAGMNSAIGSNTSRLKANQDMSGIMLHTSQQVTGRSLATAQYASQRLTRRDFFDKRSQKKPSSVQQHYKKIKMLQQKTEEKLSQNSVGLKLTQPELASQYSMRHGSHSVLRPCKVARNISCLVDKYDSIIRDTRAHKLQQSLQKQYRTPNPKTKKKPLDPEFGNLSLPIMLKYQEEEKLRAAQLKQGSNYYNGPHTATIETPAELIKNMQTNSSLQSSIPVNKSKKTLTRDSSKMTEVKMMMKRMEVYFQQQPTCLKKVITADDVYSDDSLPANKKQKGDPKDKKEKRESSVDKTIESTKSKVDKDKKKKDKKKVVIKKEPASNSPNHSKSNKQAYQLNPYYEDKSLYDIQACIDHGSRKPFFGYPLLEFGEDLSKEDYKAIKDDTLHFDHVKPNIIAQLRERQMYAHALKCFAFGKQLRRDTPLTETNMSRVEDMKRRFNRVRLIRLYYSKKRDNCNRKFDYPIDQFGRICAERADEIFDYQQYNIESDCEHEYARRNQGALRDLAFKVRRQKGLTKQVKRASMRFSSNEHGIKVPKLNSNSGGPNSQLSLFQKRDSSQIASMRNSLLVQNKLSSSGKQQKTNDTNASQDQANLALQQNKFADVQLFKSSIMMPSSNGSADQVKQSAFFGRGSLRKHINNQSHENLMTRHADSEDMRSKSGHKATSISQPYLKTVTTDDETQSQSSYWSDQEFEYLAESVNHSYCSSVLDRQDEDLLDHEHIVPFDFVTGRKAKTFFNEKPINLQLAAQEKDYLRKIEYNIQQQDLPLIDSERARRRTKNDDLVAVDKEEILIKEIPEMSKELLAHNKIQLEQTFDKTAFKDEYKDILGTKLNYDSDSDHDQTNMEVLNETGDYNGLHFLQKKKPQKITTYGRRVQNFQVRDSCDKITSVVFQRRQNFGDKQACKDKQQKLSNFKQSITAEQIHILRDRQFVIVDQKKLLGGSKNMKQLVKRNAPETLAPPLMHKATYNSSMSQAKQATPKDKMSKLKKIFMQQTDDFSYKTLLRNAAINQRINKNKKSFLEINERAITQIQQQMSQNQQEFDQQPDEEKSKDQLLDASVQMSSQEQLVADQSVKRQETGPPEGNTIGQVTQADSQLHDQSIEKTTQSPMTASANQFSSVLMSARNKEITGVQLASLNKINLLQNSNDQAIFKGSTLNLPITGDQMLTERQNKVQNSLKKEQDSMYLNTQESPERHDQSMESGQDVTLFQRNIFDDSQAVHINLPTEAAGQTQETHQSKSSIAMLQSKFLRGLDSSDPKHKMINKYLSSSELHKIQTDHPYAPLKTEGSLENHSIKEQSDSNVRGSQSFQLHSQHSVTSSHQKPTAAVVTSQTNQTVKTSMSCFDDIMACAMDIPKVPDQYDLESKDSSAEKKKEEKKGSTASKLNAFLIERLKKNSILNHKVFMREGINYKKKINHNLKKMQLAIMQGGLSVEHQAEYNVKSQPEVKPIQQKPPMKTAAMRRQTVAATSRLALERQHLDLQNLQSQTVSSRLGKINIHRTAPRKSLGYRVHKQIEA